MSLLNFFNPFGGSIQPGAGFPQYMPLPQAPVDDRTPYTGTFGADQFNQPGNVNNNTNPANGAKLGPTPTVPFGGWSELGGVANGTYSGYYQPSRPGYVPPHYDPYAQDPTGAPLSGYSQQPQAQPAAPRATPKPPEPPQNRQPMMGQWGGGGWNVGSGAPASAQPMWLGSSNGGASWGQAPGYNTRAPQAGQETSMWHTAPNQDADSPTWVQR